MLFISVVRQWSVDHIGDRTNELIEPVAAKALESSEDTQPTKKKSIASYIFYNFGSVDRRNVVLQISRLLLLDYFTHHTFLGFIDYTAHFRHCSKITHGRIELVWWSRIEVSVPKLCLIDKPREPSFRKK